MDAGANQEMKQMIEDTLFLMKIMDRTQEIDGCLEWTGALDTHGVPVIRKIGDRKLWSVRRVIFDFTGKPLGAAEVMTYRCTNSLCIKHIKKISRKDLTKRSVDLTGYPQGAARCKKIAANKRVNAKLTPKIVAEIRASGLTCREAGKRFGIAHSTAAEIIGHRMWKDYSNPFSGLMA